jgi:hypothetical protein
MDGQTKQTACRIIFIIEKLFGALAHTAETARRIQFIR